MACDVSTASSFSALSCLQPPLFPSSQPPLAGEDPQPSLHGPRGISEEREAGEVAQVCCAQRAGQRCCSAQDSVAW